MVHPHVIVNFLGWTLMEVSTSPQIGIRLWFKQISHSNIGFLHIELITPELNHYISVPDSAVFFFERLNQGIFTAISLITQTTNSWWSVIRSINSHVFLTARLIVSAIASISREFKPIRENYIWGWLRKLRFNYYLSYQLRPIYGWINPGFFCSIKRSVYITFS